MFRNQFAGAFSILVGILLAGAAGAAAPRPNIVFILTDDLGYGDLGVFFQNERQGAHRADQPAHFTPKLDAMAAEGIRLTQHYCPAPVCPPSRASLLLGVNQGHANVRDNQFDKALEDNHTLASVLRQAGYATAAVGKWGLQGKPTTKPPDWPAHPLNRGFDYYFGYIRHADGHEHYPKEGTHRGAKEVWDNRTEISASLDKCYTADLWTARAKKWIVDHHAAKADQPFFLYLAFDTPHATCELPTQAYPAGGGLKGGLQWLGKPGQMINTASGKVDSWYHPDYANATWDDDHDPKTPAKPWPDVYKRYATSVRRIDDAVGDLLQLLKDLKIDDNTLVVFTSDNGPSIESYLKEPYAPTFFGSYGPFDGIKRDCWEGGLRVPTIVRWPGTISEGQVSAVPSSFPDWMPTFAAAAGVAAPARTDGRSLMPTLTRKGEQAPPRVYIEYFHNGNTPKFEQFELGHRNRVRRQMQALRIGDYIGVRYNILSPTDDFEIYNAVTDPKEAINLGRRADFANLQKQFKETVLQVRRPGDAARPYDGELVPPIAAAAAAGEPGLAWRTYAGSFPWVPLFDGMEATAQGVSAKADLSGLPREKEIGCLYRGFIEAPADGKYTFTITADSGTLLRIHEATVIDADFGHRPGEEASASILLKAGRHPIRLYYAHRASAAPSLRLEWTGPGIAKQIVPANAFSHAAQDRPK
jgi:arylsulfatase A-like enzyme